MTLQELRFIVTLAREKHFGKASAACFVSQPTLSIAVRKLEEELSVVLFERNKTDVRITPQGEKIIDMARRILDDADTLKMLAKSSQDQLNGPFRLGVIYTAGSYILPSLIKKLSKVAPQMPLEIREDFTVNLRERLRNGELDAVVVSLPFTEVGVITSVVYREPFVVLMPEHHPLTQHESISEEQLKDSQILLIGEKHCFREQVISSCPTCFISSNWRSVEGASLETVRHMVASGMGIAILPMTAAVTNLCPYGEKFLTTRPLANSEAERSIAVAWRKNFSRPKAVETIINAIYQCDIPGAIK